MPRIDKSISTNSSSEIISSAESDSESSSSPESSFGTGEEGSSDSSTNVAHTRTPSEQYLLPLDVRCCIGSICPIAAIGSTVSLIVFGIAAAYRLGECLLELGDKEAASQLFEWTVTLARGNFEHRQFQDWAMQRLASIH